MLDELHRESLNRQIQIDLAMLEPLENGKMRVKGKKPNGVWIDETEVRMQQLRGSIASARMILENRP